MNLDTGQEKPLTQRMFRLLQISELMNLLSHRNYLDQFTTQEINESFLWLASMLLVILQTVHFKMWGCPCVDTVKVGCGEG